MPLGISPTLPASYWIDPFSGYASRKINAGNIQNEGLEISLNGTILDNPAGLSWSSTAQFSLNRNKIKELYEGVNLYDIKTFDAIQIVAPVGGYYGEIYGQTFMRVTDENSPHYGKIVVGDDGLPLILTGCEGGELFDVNAESRKPESGLDDGLDQ